MVLHALEHFKSIEKSPAMHGPLSKATRPFFLESNLGMGPRNKIPLFTPNILHQSSRLIQSFIDDVISTLDVIFLFLASVKHK